MRRFTASLFTRRDSVQETSNTDPHLVSNPSRKKPLRSLFKSFPPPLCVALPSLSKDDSTDPDSSIESSTFTTSPSRLAALIAAEPPSRLSSSSPFSRFPDSQFVFPRSVNSSKTSSLSQTLRVTVLKRQLFHLVRTNYPLSPFRPSPSEFDIPYPPPNAVVTSFSPGLSRWISRPCFEHRCAVYLPTKHGSVTVQPVTAAAFALADIEFSDALYAMVESGATSLSAPSLSVPNISPISPVPLSDVPVVPSSASITPSDIPLTTIASIQPADMPPKRGVHFTVDDKEDLIPLGYILRQKQARQAKADFLRAEADRRAQEEALRLQNERRRQEAERVRRDRNLKARERDKKIAEERLQLSYAEQVVAARIRSESARAGGVPSLKSSNNEQPFPTSASSTADRNNLPLSLRSSRQDSFTSPLFPPRREASEPNLATVTKSKPSTMPSPPSRRESSNSADSSHPPSLGTPSSPNSIALPAIGALGRNFPEGASESADMKSNFRRTTFYTNNSSASIASARVLSYPVWGGSNSSLKNIISSAAVVPMLPPMPMSYVTADSPLLPPSAPFMMHSHQRLSTSQNSLSGSSRGNLSRDSSRERLTTGPPITRNNPRCSNRIFHGPRSSSFPENLNSHHLLPSRSHSRPAENLRSKTVSFHATSPLGEKSSSAHPQRPQPRTYSSWNQVKEPDSPWTGMPTQSGRLPNGMVHTQSSAIKSKN